MAARVSHFAPRKQNLRPFRLDLAGERSRHSPVIVVHCGPRPAVLPAPVSPSRASIGLTSTAGLVIGSVIGIGVFTVQAALASASTAR